MSLFQRSSNPKLSTNDLVKSANELLDKAGIGFAISLDAATCERLRVIKAAQKDPSTRD